MGQRSFYKYKYKIGMLDYAIVGGGIAGLYAAINLAKQYPNAKISLFEKYRIFGGRVLTFRDKGFQWEAGAGRIHSSHTLVLELFKQYNIKLAPISSGISWVETYGSPIVPNPWESSLPTWLDEIKRLPKEQLAQHTLFELLVQIFGKTKAETLVKPFPYYAEIHTLRADLAIESFSQEMGTHDHYSYSPEGYDTLIEKMVQDCEKHGVQLYNHYELISISPTRELSFATGPLKNKNERQVKQISANHILLALHADALRKIPFVRDLSVLNLVEMQPLHRIYAVFPTKQGKSWFSDIGRFVTGTPIRYFIPINPAKGVVMISYTDGADTAIWSALAKGSQPSEEALGYLLTEECRKLFPDRHIPYPTFLTSHPWESGCTYWLPGNYDPKKESKNSLNPFPNIYICGESFSLRQAWIEGALENTRDLLRVL